MARKGACSVCDHPDVESLNEQLASGATYRDIADLIGTSLNPVMRHVHEHLGVERTRRRNRQPGRPMQKPKCSVCNHPEREQIERLMKSPKVTYKQIESAYGLPQLGVSYHGRMHMGIVRQTARLCSVCVHGAQQTIDGELLSGKVSMASVAERYALSIKAVSLHRRNHLHAEGRPAPQCAICLHSDREEIERECDAGRRSVALIARWFEVTALGIHNHMKVEHVATDAGRQLQRLTALRREPMPIEPVTAVRANGVQR